MKRPRSISIEYQEGKKDYGKIIAAPLERGYGTTLGNSIRRTLLSALQGYAIVALHIEAYDKEKQTMRLITSEFDTIPGMVEDTIDFILNLIRVFYILEGVNGPDQKYRAVLNFLKNISNVNTNDS